MGSRSASPNNHAPDATLSRGHHSPCARLRTLSRSLSRSRSFSRSLRSRSLRLRLSLRLSLSQEDS